MTPPDLLESAIRELLAARDPHKTICPSEAARRVDPQGWQRLMEPVREVGRRLAADHVIEVRQRGTVVDATTARGPIRYGRGPQFDG